MSGIVEEDLETGCQSSRIEGRDHAPCNDTNEQLKRFILSSAEGAEDMWKEKEFVLVVKTFLESNKRLQDFYSLVESWARNANETLLMMSYVLELYDRDQGEGRSTESEEDSKCSRKLEDLTSLKERNEGRDLEERFVNAIKLVYEEEEGKGYMHVLEEVKRVDERSPSKDEVFGCLKAVLEEQNEVYITLGYHMFKKLEKRLIRTKKLRKASKIMFGIGFFTVPILTGLVMVVPVPSAIEVLIGAFSATVGSTGKWCVYLCNKREVSTEFQKIGVHLMENIHLVLAGDLDFMQGLVHKMIDKTECVVKVAQSVKRKLPQKELVDEIRSFVIDCWVAIEGASSQASKCNRVITASSQLVSEKLSTLRAPSTPKSKSWMDIFM